ncbi:response regulator transcription factor [Streptomyces chiangmaiensis]
MCLVRHHLGDWDTAGYVRATGCTRPHPQETELLRLLGQGLTDQAIAVRLGVSHRTAQRFAASLMEKLGARSRFEAGFKAAARGWLLPEQ